MEGTNKATLRERARPLFLFVASLFLIWHTVAIIFVGPGPDSYLLTKVKPLFTPYLKLFQLNNYWGFYTAPDDYGKLLSYEIVTGSDTKKHFELTKGLRRSDPVYFRYTASFANFLWGTEQADKLLQGFALHLCAAHSDLAPQSLSFLVDNQTKLSRENYVHGARPLDADRLSREIIGPISCKSEPV